MPRCLIWFNIPVSILGFAVNSASAQNQGKPESELALARANCAECHAI